MKAGEHFEGAMVHWHNEYFFITMVLGKVKHSNRSSYNVYAIRDASTTNVMNQKRYQTLEEAIRAAKGMTRRRERKIEKLLLGT